MRQPRNFAELQGEIFTLYRAASYQEALEILTAHGGHFPLHANTITLWKACLAARTGQPAMARWFLEEGIAAGEWWAPAILQADPDLEPLRGDAEFERLTGLCRQRQEAAEAESLGLLLSAEPQTTPPWPALVALHGSSWNGVSFARHWRAARDAGWLLAAPQSSQCSGPDRYGWMDKARAIAEIAGHLESLLAAGRADEDRLVAGGFSAGANLALALPSRTPHPVRGVIAVAPPIAPDDETIRERAEALADRKVRVVLVAGTRDVHGVDGIEAFASAYAKAGGDARTFPCEGASHEFPAGFGDILRESLAWIAG